MQDGGASLRQLILLEWLLRYIDAVPGGEESDSVVLKACLSMKMSAIRSLMSGVGARGMAAAAEAATASKTTALKTTALHARHEQLGGKMVPFAGYSMPVQYPDGIKDSHLFVRKSAGLFDVSHMGQVRLHGADRVRFLEKLVVADLEALAVGRAQLSLLMAENGGVIDDTIITNMGDHLAMVINAGCKEKDVAHMQLHLDAARKAGMDVRLEIVRDHELLALQGPRAAQVLSEMVSSHVDLTRMSFMNATRMDVDGLSCVVTRCGYTGEDGFELSVPMTGVTTLFDTLISRDEVRPAGLGARDSLRLEAGLCLYGNDMDEQITPVEAGLTWTIGRRRREGGAFLGAERVLPQLRDGVEKKRMMFVMKRGAPARGGETLTDEEGRAVGVVTSGGYSPSLGCAIGMGYAQRPANKSGTRLRVAVRSKVNDVVVTKMPLVATNYYTAPPL